MCNRLSYRRLLARLCLVFLIITTFAACGASPTGISTGAASPVRTAKQTLTFPNVGTQDIYVMDPALSPDQNSQIAVQMIYSGLVRSDQSLHVIPDQATWEISGDNRTYTFHLNPNVAFSDGMPVTAQTYVYSWTRALLPELKSPTASFFEAPIVGANTVNQGKTKILTGVKALNAQTLRVTLSRPTPYFLQLLTNPLFYPVNKKLIDLYGENNWTQHVQGMGAGTGPFMVKEWQHNLKMVLTPNPYYYGPHSSLKTVNMVFADDPSTAFKSYRAGQFDFIWNLIPQDQASMKSSASFLSAPQLSTESLFFNPKIAPFDKLEVRQAFAYGTDKDFLAHTVLQDAVLPAPTLLPSGLPGYQETNSGLAFDKTKAQSLLQSVYPDVKQVPPITFSYPSSQVSSTEATALQTMWQQNLGIKVNLRPVEQNAYNDETSMHQVQFGYVEWTADFPDPYDLLALDLLSTSVNNVGQWTNPDFDHLVNAAERTTDANRMALYEQAEQIAINDVAWLPIDYPTMAAVIPGTVHGIQLNGEGLYFGNWSQVSVT